MYAETSILTSSIRHKSDLDHVICRAVVDGGVPTVHSMAIHARFTILKVDIIKPVGDENNSRQIDYHS